MTTNTYNGLREVIVQCWAVTERHRGTGANSVGGHKAGQAAGAQILWGEDAEGRGVVQTGVDKDKKSSRTSKVVIQGSIPPRKSEPGSLQQCMAGRQEAIDINLNWNCFKWKGRKSFFILRTVNHEPGCPENLCSLYHWRFSRPDRIKPRATWSGLHNKILLWKSGCATFIPL